MDTEEFRQRGKEMVDYMCDYMLTLRNRPVSSDVVPNYLRRLLPEEAPQDPEPWQDIMVDFEAKIMPGINHWNHPNFYAYYPSGNSYPAMLGGMLADVMGCHAFSWASSPACTELETIVMDWLGKAVGLPCSFLSVSKGGGVLQASGSDCVLVCMVAAREQTLEKLSKMDPSVSKSAHLPKLVAYTSIESHSCVEKAALIAFVQLRVLETDSNNSLRGDILIKAIEEDRKKGLVPFFVSAILGSTGSCSFDSLEELGPVARENDCWLHADAAYAGSAFICPEFRHLLKGVDMVDSFGLNACKWLLVTFDCSCLWVKNREKFTQNSKVDQLYLQHINEDEVVDYRHWSIQLTRRFRALKLWFTLRSYGISGLQNYIRNYVRLAKRLEGHVRTDKRFQVMNDVRMGLVCFRLVGEGDDLTINLFTNINRSGKLHLVPARIKDKYVIRVCILAQNETEKDIDYAWSVFSTFATNLLSEATLSVSSAQA